jgi:ankyrin
LLLANNANVNAKDSFGMTPLHWAAMESHLEVAKTLLAHGADVNARSAGGQVSSRPSGKATQVETLQLEGATPLHWAGLEGRLDFVKLLLDSHADANAKDTKGYTPLHYAAVKDHADVAGFLRQHGGSE